MLPLTHKETPQEQSKELTGNTQILRESSLHHHYGCVYIAQCYFLVIQWSCICMPSTHMELQLLYRRLNLQQLRQDNKCSYQEYQLVQTVVLLTVDVAM